MDIKNLAELEKIIALCRRKGVKSFKIDGIEMALTDELPASNYKKKQLTETGSDRVEIDQIYDEDAALFWSSAGLPTEKEAV